MAFLCLMFYEAAQVVGKLRHKRLANLIGCCCEGDERLLVAENMPSDTVAKLLFHWEKQTIEWLLRLRVTFYIAEVLDYSNTEGLPPYRDLNAYKALFDEDGGPRLSCFSPNHAYRPSEYLENDQVLTIKDRF
ncbi:hypothetical protein CISIN_1g041547mg [Citrus sinensis]|uniref:Serine-threonine/tyrosine-protein kinase catalytic domain-containing protein n=1 Tax=Citrus sinensis TaxID=2711 RepID=A0A067FYJ2_CITSI|nr:hypothetical protein CISIN_1g041547mg [Citrus sinensis]